MGLGKQAKTLTKGQIDAILAYLSTTRHPERYRLIFLLSALTGVLALPMSRRDIADYLGLALETVSRALSVLRALGILRFADTSQRQIVLEDRQKLQRFNS